MRQRLVLSLSLLALAAPAVAQTPDAGAAPPESAAPEAPVDTEPGAAEDDPEPVDEAEETPAPEPEPEPVVEAPEPSVEPAAVAEAEVASEAGEDEEDEEIDGATAAGRALATVGDAPPTTFAFWRDGDQFIKPVLQIGALLVGYFPHSDVNEDLAMRVSTLALARFGFEGQLFGFLTFRSVFERNLGYSLARNGPVGTSVWEGTASLQARENYLRIAKWGVSLTGGIFPDPASLDFVSANVLDAFGMDPYVRDPLLVSGFGQGQGVMLRYGWKMLDFGVSFTGGNPLTTSLAFGFGGDVSALGTLFSAPLRALSNGIPGSDIQLYTLSPSATLDLDVFEMKVAAQLYNVDIDVAGGEDERLRGYNLRATAKVKPIEELSIFGSFAYRQNQQLAIPDVTMLRPDDYEGYVAAGGADFNWGAFSVGGMYYYIRATFSETTQFTNHYINFGATYWLHQPNVAVSLRWGRSMASAEPMEPRLKATDSLILSMRLLI
ncbi:MAG: hypothetical protein JJ863_33870 [Deltaproteobacteria bacterium]|nr:hypothetical protein [Deltaproteobacteria bacterium]